MGCEKFQQFARCFYGKMINFLDPQLDNNMLGFNSSSAKNFWRRSFKFWWNEMFFHKLVFDHKNCENFCLAKICYAVACYTVLLLLACYWKEWIHSNFQLTQSKLNKTLVFVLLPFNSFLVKVECLLYSCVLSCSAHPEYDYYCLSQQLCPLYGNVIAKREATKFHYVKSVTLCHK